MNSFKQFIVTFAVLVPLLAGCGKSDDGRFRPGTAQETASQLEQAFEGAPAAVQQSAHAVSEALRQREYDKAVVALGRMQQAEGVTLDQGLAVHRTRIVLERDLAQAMANGDEDAKRTFEMLRRMNRN